jgi:hypothetical protein
VALAHHRFKFTALLARQHDSSHASSFGGYASDFNDSVD